VLRCKKKRHSLRYRYLPQSEDLPTANDFRPDSNFVGTCHRFFYERGREISPVILLLYQCLCLYDFYFFFRFYKICNPTDSDCDSLFLSIHFIFTIPFDRLLLSLVLYDTFIIFFFLKFGLFSIIFILPFVLYFLFVLLLLLLLLLFFFIIIK